MAEWPKAHDWKSCIPLKGIEGSNPSLSANNKKARHKAGFFVIPAGKEFEPEERVRQGREADGSTPARQSRARTQRRSASVANPLLLSRLLWRLFCYSGGYVPIQL